MKPHTPGPWGWSSISGHHAVIGPGGVIVAFCDHAVIGPDGVIVAFCGLVNDDVEAQTLADLALIKEAPGMLALLRRALPIIDAHRRWALGEVDLTAASIRAVLDRVGGEAS